MIVEYAQLLSSAKRLIDGKLEDVYVSVRKSIVDQYGNKKTVLKLKKKKWYTLDSDVFAVRFGLKILLDKDVYAITHQNHPSAVWVRESDEHYIWLHTLMSELCSLYNNNSGGKTHKTSEKLGVLSELPSGIQSNGFCEPPQCMPDEYQQDSTTEAYMDYLTAKYVEWETRDKPIKVEFY
jgi:hypothetical protein